MTLLQAFLEALESLLANKLRSALTVLGIVIGVASVIAMVSLGRGVQSSVNDQLSGAGASQLNIFSSYDPAIRRPQPLTVEDGQAIASQLAGSGVRQVAAFINGGGTVSYGSKSTSTSVYGVTANFVGVNNLKLLEGVFLTEEHLAGQSAVAVIGPQLARKLFARDRGVIGELVRVEGQPYRILGVLQDVGGAGLSLTSTDNALLIPLSTAQVRMAFRANRKQVDALVVQVEDPDRIKQVTDQVSQVLRLRHHSPVGADDFQVFAAQSLLDAFNQITGVMTVFLGGVAAISLVVGGIGIMNIMLVTVTERTREIGLRKALGASKRDILVQFLVESAMLSLSGGLIGITIGWAIGLVITMFAKSSGVSINFTVGLDAVALATLFSSAIGIFFGFYPANRAARLQPVEALRSE